MTIDDQIAALAPLTPGAVALLAGYKAAGSITTKRARGKAFSGPQLARVAAGLRALAVVADRLAAEEGGHEKEGER